MPKDTSLNLNNLRADILRLCATQDAHGNTGVAPTFYRRMKPAPYRELMLLAVARFVTFDTNAWAVATGAGESALADWDAQEGSQA